MDIECEAIIYGGLYKYLIYLFHFENLYKNFKNKIHLISSGRCEEN